MEKVPGTTVLRSSKLEVNECRRLWQLCKLIIKLLGYLYISLIALKFASFGSKKIIFDEICPDLGDLIFSFVSCCFYMSGIQEINSV